MKTVHICEAGNPALLMPPFHEYNPSSIERTRKVSISLSRRRPRQREIENKCRHVRFQNVDKKEKKIYLFLFNFPSRITGSRERRRDELI